MKCFDHVTDTYLKTDAQGRTIFFPWRDLGAGYVLPDTATREQVIRCLKRHHLISLVIVYGGIPAAGGMSSPYYFGLLLLALLWFVAAGRSLVRGLEVAQERPGFRDGWANQARMISFPGLWFCFGFFFLLAWGSARLLSRDHLLTGVAGIAFSTILGNLCGYMILVKAGKA